MPMSEYYQSLRLKLGSELLMIPSVAAVIRNDKDEILFIRKHDDTLWGLPAGAIEPGETPARALRREVFEETGLMVNPAKILGVFGGEKFRYVYSNGHQVEYLAIVFECTIVKGTLRSVDGEVEEFEYFKINELPELSVPYPKEIFTQNASMTISMFE
ncbi:NUDIX domain-containing protein [Paenibacillus wynnii]|uniref:NUDIX domain-containing protein n=1 Tax=Paenibacillus wynnii TaxID=268407 RepID=UPI0027950016|nr:NUDIX domain-containing protein [Paenibacillus wynnii]MDQ0196367.1 ADP-ribose pyrophosphatase YjhB (NUDIX family) [Paenibacillus wynnii]